VEQAINALKWSRMADDLSYWLWTLDSDVKPYNLTWSVGCINYFLPYCSDAPYRTVPDNSV